MKINVIPKSQFLAQKEFCCLAIPLFEEPLSTLSTLFTPVDGSTVERLCEADVISSKAMDVYLLPTPLSIYANILVLGLGHPETFTAEVLRRTAGKAGLLLQQNRTKCIVLDISMLRSFPIASFVEGLLLGLYRFDEFKTKDETKPPEVLPREVTFLVNGTMPLEKMQSSCATALAMCDCANWARELACMPPNLLTPAELAARAKAMAHEVGFRCDIFDEDQMTKLGMNALLAVARGSEQRARLIVLQYQHPKATRTLALVGKGITFDTGGISIKPSEAMHEMKYDMCGAAAVLGAMRAISALKPAVNVVAVIPAAENMPGANAQRPGDIVKAYNGKTIEILNTDAEGRLVLADALAYAVDKYKPDCVVNLATLTGACVAALGHYAAGLMATDDALAQRLERAGEHTGERVWRLPLWDDYDKLVEGDHADLANIGPKGEAGAIVGGCFLKHFVGDTPWAHLDIAGTSWGAKNIPYLSDKHPSGYGVRLLAQWILDEADA